MLVLVGYLLVKIFVFYDMFGSLSVGFGEVIVDCEGKYQDDFLFWVDCVIYEFEYLFVEVVEKLVKEKLVYFCFWVLKVC